MAYAIVFCVSLGLLEFASKKRQKAEEERKKHRIGCPCECVFASTCCYLFIRCVYQSIFNIHRCEFRFRFWLVGYTTHDENEAAGASWQNFIFFFLFQYAIRTTVTYCASDDWYVYCTQRMKGLFIYIDVRRSIDSICFERLNFFPKYRSMCVVRVAQSVLVRIEWNFFLLLHLVSIYSVSLS